MSTQKSESTSIPGLWSWREQAMFWPWGKPPAQGGTGGKGDIFTFFAPQILLSKLLQWNIIAFHFIFKNCCQGSLLASWSQHKSENTYCKGVFLKLGFEMWFTPSDQQVEVQQTTVTWLHFTSRDSVSWLPFIQASVQMLPPMTSLSHIAPTSAGFLAFVGFFFFRHLSYPDIWLPYF